MKRRTLMTSLLPVILNGTGLQGQTSHKVNLGFEDKVPGWLAEKHVPAVGIGIVDKGEIIYARVFGEL